MSLSFKVDGRKRNRVSQGINIHFPVLKSDQNPSDL